MIPAVMSTYCFLLCPVLDPNILLPSFASQALSGNIRCKPEMVEWLAGKKNLFCLYFVRLHMLN